VPLRRSTRRPRQPRRLHDELVPTHLWGQFKQLSGRSALSARVKKQMRKRRGGFSSRVKHAGAKKPGRRGFEEGAPYKHVVGDTVYTFSRRSSEIDGIGLFAEHDIKAGAALGCFLGAAVSRSEAAALRKQKKPCIIEFEYEPGKRAYFDGSRGPKSPFVWVNCADGTRGPNVQFQSDGVRLCVYTCAPVSRGDELVARYTLVR
jgi:hypothetical protein